MTGHEDRELRRLAKRLAHCSERRGHWEVRKLGGKMRSFLRFVEWNEKYHDAAHAIAKIGALL